MTCYSLRSRYSFPALLGFVFASLSLAVLAEPASPPEPLYQVSTNIVYGHGPKSKHELQSLDVYWHKNKKPRPVIIYVHGGGWAFGDKGDVGDKPGFFAHHKIDFVSMNYRLRWEASLFDQLEDVVSVVAWVRHNADKYGFDPARVILMGEGAGAHLASMVATDEKLLKTAGLSLSDIRMVVSMDNSGFDIPKLMSQSGNFLEKRRYRLVFGDDSTVWGTLSPINYVAPGKGIPPFAVMYTHNNESTTDQARLFARSLRDAGVNVIMIPSNSKSSVPVEASLGMAGDAPTLALIAFIGAAI